MAGWERDAMDGTFCSILTVVCFSALEYFERLLFHRVTQFLRVINNVFRELPFTPANLDVIFRSRRRGGVFGCGVWLFVFSPCDFHNAPGKHSFLYIENDHPRAELGRGGGQVERRFPPASPAACGLSGPARNGRFSSEAAGGVATATGCWPALRMRGAAERRAPARGLGRRPGGGSPDAVQWAGPSLRLSCNACWCVVVSGVAF